MTSEAALRSWVTRRLREAERKHTRREAALKAWMTRRLEQHERKLAALKAREVRKKEKKRKAAYSTYH
jgi:hypothetical protein